jgi:hypothetical protein
MLSSLLSAAITVLLFAPSLLSVALAMLPRPHSAALAVLPSQCCLRCAAVTPTAALTPNVQADVIDNPFCFSSLILFNINLNK